MLVCYNICMKYYLQVNMDTNDNELNSLNCPIEVIDSASDKGNVTEGKRKRKRSILLMEYLCKRRKRHAIQKKKKLAQEESYASKYQDEFTKFSQNSIDNDANILKKKRCVKSRLGLYQSRLKNNRYRKQLMKSNPVKHAQAFGKETKGKRKCKKERKEVSTPGQYILNEHTGNLEKKEMVQIPSCRKCNHVVTIDAETQVQAKDIHGKVFRNTSSQCEILHSTERNDKCQIRHEAEIVSVTEDHVLDLESIQMEYTEATSLQETKKCEIAEMNKIQIESRCTAVVKNVSDDRISNGKKLNGKIDGEDDVMYNINGDE